MRNLFKHPLRTLVAWDRHPGAALLLRLATVGLLLRPWAFRVLPMPLRAEDLDPGILAMAQSLGMDPFLKASWPTATGTILRALAVWGIFALAWWIASRLRSLLVRRRGPGALATLLVLACYLGWAVACGPLAQALMVPGGYDSNGVAVWQAMVFHPWIQPSAMAEYLVSFGLVTFVAIELGLMAAEGGLLLAEAREGALRARLSPHFLFNTLNTLEAQIEDDPQGALDTTQRLSALFEQVQRVTDQPLVPLRQELALVEDILALERRRLGGRLDVDLDVPEELLDRKVPVLGLQVLVENAIRHAIAPRVEGGRLVVRAVPEGTGLWIHVEDSGDGQSRGRTGTGKALANLRARLRRPSDLVLEPCPLGFRARFRWV